MNDGETIKGDLSKMVGVIADHILQGEDRSPHLMIGPLVWKDEDCWYFVIGSNDRDGFRVDKIVVGEDRPFGEQLRSFVYFEFLQRQPIVLHDFDDELEMAKWCEGIWPSEQTRQIRAAMESERAMWETQGTA
jgi:hypothetical protein